MKNFIERLEKLKMTSKTQLVEMYNLAITDAISIYTQLHPSTEIIAPEPNKAENLPSFKVRVTKSDGLRWYKDRIGQEFEVKKYGDFCYCVVDGEHSFNRILISDCEIIPETQTIPFDYKRWKDGDFLRVVTRDGREVTQLTYFDADILYPLCGVKDHILETWTKGGHSCADFCSDESNNLHLEISTPKPKEYWVNVFKNSYGNLFSSICETEKQFNIEKTAENLVKTIKFTI